MITLQYFNGKEWVNVGQWLNERMAWISLGSDNFNYRTIDENGNIQISHNTNNRFLYFQMLNFTILTK
jgi:hypothetical protein